MFASILPGRPIPAASPGGVSPTPNVLLIHFDKLEADRFVGYLGDSYRVFPVRVERQLWSALEAQPAQAIIINAAMGCPKDGFQLCSRLKSVTHLAHVIVILVIAANNQAARIDCLESGADAWLEQPLSRDYLRAQLRNLFANRRRLKSHFGHSPLFGFDPMHCTGRGQSFLARLSRIIFEHLADTGLTVDMMARLMNMSRPTLYRKIKRISDRTPNELVTVIRLNRAAELLSTGDNKILEIAKMVGFHSRSNFGKAFIKHFGVAPMEYRLKAFQPQK